MKSFTEELHILNQTERLYKSNLEREVINAFEKLGNKTIILENNVPVITNCGDVVEIDKVSIVFNRIIFRDKFTTYNFDMSQFNFENINNIYLEIERAIELIYKYKQSLLD